eukprot:2917945-Pyramimonas_sp.AAC.1
MAELRSMMGGIESSITRSIDSSTAAFQVQLAAHEASIIALDSRVETAQSTLLQHQSQIEQLGAQIQAVSQWVSQASSGASSAASSSSTPSGGGRGGGDGNRGRGQQVGTNPLVRFIGTFPRPVHKNAREAHYRQVSNAHPHLLQDAEPVFHAVAQNYKI